MENRKKNIVVWLIIWGGLLLVILYSPIGSPDLYTAKKYFIPDQGVQFKDAEIANASSWKHRMGNNAQTYVPDFNSSKLSNPSYPVNVAQNSANSGSLAIPTQGFSQVNSTQETASTGSGTDGSIIPFVVRSGKHTSTSPPTNGFMALKTDLNGLPGNTLFKSNEGTADVGDPDPGGAPAEDPIPVGDGWGLLILFGLCYILLKRWMSIG